MSLLRIAILTVIGLVITLPSFATGSPAVGWVTIVGSQAADSGYVTVSVYNCQVTYSYSAGDTVDSVVTGVAAMLNNSCTSVTASAVANNVLVLKSTMTGSAANSSLYAIYDGDFSTGTVGMIGGRDGARNFQMSLYYQSGTDADIGYQLIPFPNADPQLTPQPPGHSVLNLGNTWEDSDFETQLTNALNQKLIDLTRVDAIYVDEPYVALLGNLSGNPCSDPSRIQTIRNGYNELQAAAAVIKKYSPRTRFWVNFSQPEAGWLLNGFCTSFQLDPSNPNSLVSLNAPYIDVVSLDWYLVDFNMTVKPAYEWFLSHPSYPGQQIALIPGTFVYGPPKTQNVDPIVQAQLLEEYFDYATNKNQSCTLPLGNNGVTGSFDGCPVWMVIGWIYSNKFAFQGYIGLSDPASGAIQAAWQAELSAPRVDPRHPAIENFARIANGDNFFYIDEAGDVLQSWTNSGSFNASGWHTPSITGIAGAPPAIAGSYLLAYNDPASNNGNIVYVGTDAHVHLLWWNGDPWKTLDLTAIAGGPNAQPGFPFVQNGGGNSFEYLGADGNIWLFWNNSGSSTTSWQTANLNAISGAPTPASGGFPLGYTDPVSSNSDTYYVGTDGHVHLLWWNGDPWHTIDLTAVASGPNAQAGTHFVRTGNGNNFFYLGVDGNVYQFWNSGSSSSASTWHSPCITCIAGAPIAAAGSSFLAYVDPVSSNQDVLYIGADQHVHLLWWNGDPWRTIDLTATAGGANASVLSPTILGSNNFFYVGTDGNIWQLVASGSSSNASGWVAPNISAIAGAPPAIPGAAMLNYVYSSEAVYYAGSDQHVHLLWWTADPWQTLDITAVTSGPGVW